MLIVIMGEGHKYGYHLHFSNLGSFRSFLGHHAYDFLFVFWAEQE